MNIKSVSVLSLAAMCCMSSSVLALNDKIITCKQAEDTAILFATTSMSDFVEESKYRDDLIHSDAEALIRYLDDKREIQGVKEDLYGGVLSLISYDVNNVRVREKDSLFEVCFNIKYDYLDGEEPSGLVAGYKVDVDKDTNTVVAALTNDLSGGSLIIETLSQKPEELNLDYQLDSMNSVEPLSEENLEQPYNLNQRLDKLFDYKKEQEKEFDNDGGTNEFATVSDITQSTYATFVSFDETDRASMRSYQDSWWHKFNPDFTDFTNYGGDCTNYASQVLNSSSTPQYSSSSSGIQGTSYWYYRSSSNRSSSWTGVEELREFLLNNTEKGPSGKTVTTFGALESGDIIQLHNGSKFYHTVVVYTQGGDPWVTAHTSPYSGRYSTRYGGIDYSRVHISGYYK